MTWFQLWLFLAAGLCLVSLAWACWQLAAEPKFWRWKSELQLLTGVLFVAALFAGATAHHVFELQVPLTEISGTIQNSGLPSSRFSETTRIEVRTDSGELLTLTAQKSTFFFNSGQRIHASYIDSTKELVSAQTFMPSGSSAATYVNHRSWADSWMVADLLIFVALWVRYFVVMALVDSSGDKGYGGYTVGDTIAEKFTPEDRPGEHWEFDESGEHLASTRNHKDD